jgi:DNA replicative helicase MCM subunit Mcm2 (Cdc46/Mcm family)
MGSLMSFDDFLSRILKEQPTQTIPTFEKAIQTVYRNHYVDTENVYQIPTFQLQVTSEENPIMIRDLQSNRMGTLVVVPGIITASTKTMIKSTCIVIKCSNCGHEKRLAMKAGFAGTQMPRTCD